ncbi:MAG: hypothetical protein ABL881_03995 [Novosphingobium sp.]
MKHLILPALLGTTVLAAPALAQDHSGHAGHQEPEKPQDHSSHQGHPTGEKPEAVPQDEHAGMDHSGHQAPGRTKTDYSEGCSKNEVPWLDDSGEVIGSSEFLTCRPISGSGTSRLPAKEGAMHGVHIMSGDWMLMAHGSVSLQYTDHSGPRGDSQTYVTSMAMVTAQRDTGWGRVQFKSMLSLEPLMAPPGYPNLFATGETAFGQPIIDRQHPHDLFMELAARIDINAGSGSLFLYGGPVGEPALGPSAFMHRGSAKYNPEPPISHHWFDSTHITYGVVTVGYAAPKWQIEASAFRGREPDEARWNIETPKLDSWSVRGTFNPSPKWSLQVSYGELKEPEALHPGEDEQRFTGSVHYANGKGLSAMAAFSRKGHDGDNHNSWLTEANWDLDPRNSLFSRIEVVDNGELFPNPLDPLHDEHFTVTKFQAGYARRIPVGPFELALGGSLSAYAKPAALDAAYGANPWGYTLFARINLGN